MHLKNRSCISIIVHNIKAYFCLKFYEMKVVLLTTYVLDGRHEYLLGYLHDVVQS